MNYYEPSTRYLSVGEAAEMLKMHRNTVYRYCRNGRFPAVKIGRKLLIDRRKLDKLLENKRRPLIHELREARTRRGLNYASLAQKTGIPEHRIIALENGTAMPLVSELERIWGVLGQFDHMYVR